VKNFVKIFKALSNEKRFKILLLLLKRKEMTVSEIAENLKFPFQTTSRHLINLQNANLVETRHENVWTFYYLSSRQKKLIKNILHLMNKYF